MIIINNLSRTIDNISGVVQDNLEDVILRHGDIEFGKAKIQYITRELKDCTFQEIQTNDFDIKTNTYLYNLLPNKEKIKDIIIENNQVKKIDGGFRFKVPEDAKEKIKKEYLSRVNSFLQDIKNKNIRIFIRIVGCDFPRSVLVIKENRYKNLDAQELFFNFLYENYPNLGNAYEWIEKEFEINDLDVTDRVHKEMERIDNISKEKELKKQQVFQIAKLTGVRQLLSKYYCECQTNHPDCTKDMVEIYALPDGTTQAEVIHTYEQDGNLTELFEY